VTRPLARKPAATATMTHSNQISQIVRRFNGCNEGAVSSAIAEAVLKIKEIAKFIDDTPPRGKAREHFHGIAAHALALRQAIADEAYQHIFYQDVVNSTGLGISEALEILDRLATVASLRASLISSGAGGFNYADEAGLPNKKSLIATFMILLWERERGRKPGTKNEAASLICHDIWQMIDGYNERDVNVVGTWKRVIGDAKKGINESEKMRQAKNDERSRLRVGHVGMSLRATTPVTAASFSPAVERTSIASWNAYCLMRDIVYPAPP
jgi:hypothetical protein